MRTELINGQPYQILETWDEFSFKQFIPLSKLAAQQKLDFYNFLSVVTSLDISTLKTADISEALKTTVNSLLNQGVDSLEQFFAVPTQMRFENYSLTLLTEITLDYRSQFKAINEALTRSKGPDLINEYPFICAVYFEGLFSGGFSGEEALMETENLANANWLDVVLLGNHLIMSIIKDQFTNKFQYQNLN